MGQTSGVRGDASRAVPQRVRFWQKKARGRRSALVREGGAARSRMCVGVGALANVAMSTWCLFLGESSHLPSIAFLVAIRGVSESSAAVLFDTFLRRFINILCVWVRPRVCLPALRGRRKRRRYGGSAVLPRRGEALLDIVVVEELRLRALRRRMRAGAR